MRHATFIGKFRNISNVTNSMKECVFEKLVVPQLLMMDGGKITK
jgi:hypothetical protein